MIHLTPENNFAKLSRRTSAKFRGTILLVDDDRNWIDSLTRWFEGEGYETKPTFHPFYGLKMAVEEKIDVAVIDINMPDMNGIEFLRELVQLDAFPVIVHTDETEPGLVRTVHELGALACFSKPTNLDDVKTSIEQAISQF